MMEQPIPVLRHDSRNLAVRSHLLGSARLKEQVAEECLNSILQAADLIATSFRSGSKLLLCGNGGSAADCQHMAQEIQEGFGSPPMLAGHTLSQHAP
ncbi:MAG: SIS domain-containing protein [Chloroflexota bacterium]